MNKIQAFIVGFNLAFVLATFLWISINKVGNWGLLRDLYRFFLILTIILAFGYFVYPTPYHYSMYRGQYPLVINWITKESYVFNGSEWRIVDNKIGEEIKEEK